MKQEIEQHLKRSEELIIVAEENLKNNHPADSINRSYYSMFHSATAVLLNLGIERSSHKGLIAAFGEHVVKKEIMEKKYHAHLRNAFEARIESDYMPFPDESNSSAQTTLQQARDFFVSCSKYLGKTKY
ncbi:hypothetical protein MNBD_NITROSPINAE03-47 [hydrothermal vent metagenome]|uniref:HEPN domain-containing protein n=1 Tax=hydrothermal vent metagenome TaxID=652676 RepID=A0A3B1BVI2_9ZZZZ